MSARPRAIPSSGRKIAFYHPALRAAHFTPPYWGTWLGLIGLRVIAPLPLALTRIVGGALGLVMCAVNRKRRQIAKTNLRLCFPAMPPRERARLLYRHFIAYGQSFTDVAHLTWNPRWRLRRMLRWRGIDTYRALLARDQRVILLVPHLVGINFSGALLAGEHPTFSIVRPLRNEVMDWLLHRARTRFGASSLARDQGLRPAIHALKQGYVFHYSPDEDFGPDRSVFAPFFGIATATLPTLGRIARTGSAVVVPCFVRLRTWGRGYEVLLQPPLENFPTGSASEDARRMNRVMEDGIRAMPEQYFWTFKLFKTRPAGESSPYR